MSVVYHSVGYHAGEQRLNTCEYSYSERIGEKLNDSLKGNSGERRSGESRGYLIEVSDSIYVEIEEFNGKCAEYNYNERAGDLF